jgi:ubiquinone/menaquinone biosynthesis C-methylase UbiE
LQEISIKNIPVSMSLQRSYHFIAPFYDVFLARLTAGSRQRSLSRLPQQGAARVLLSGAGTGLDFPFLHLGHDYTALDLTSAMLQRSRNRGRNLQMDWVQGDSMALPFDDQQFDYVVLHLIVAVVPQPERCLAEAARVLKPGGRILVFDKFLQRGERAWLRRSLSRVVAKLATRLDVVFEDVLAGTPNLSVVSNEPALAGGWFRLIELQRNE